ncbi:MAG: hypothetical protein PHC64_06930 [Candidatus Gastranaerophilales bacterium]|nr:hypothetical protein [Candidatus Gastranaerophilales bacterium]
MRITALQSVNPYKTGSGSKTSFGWYKLKPSIFCDCIGEIHTPIPIPALGTMDLLRSALNTDCIQRILKQRLAIYEGSLQFEINPHENRIYGNFKNNYSCGFGFVFDPNIPKNLQLSDKEKIEALATEIKRFLRIQNGIITIK